MYKVDSGKSEYSENLELLGNIGLFLVIVSIQIEFSGLGSVRVQFFQSILLNEFDNVGV